VSGAVADLPGTVAPLPTTRWAGEDSAVRIDGTALAARTLEELRVRVDRLH